MTASIIEHHLTNSDQFTVPNSAQSTVLPHIISISHLTINVNIAKQSGAYAHAHAYHFMITTLAR